MVKFKAICRDENDYQRRTTTEIEKVFRNPKQSLHPFQKNREYVRALNAVKLERVFAKPFLFSLNDHTDGVKCLAKNTRNLSEIVSGSFDGQVILWNLSERKPKYIINSNHNFVKGVCFSSTGEDFLSCGDDSKISLWNIPSLALAKQKEANKNLNNINNNEHVMKF